MLDTVSTLTSYLRQIVSLFDFAVYYILQYIYTIFFYVAQFNFVDGEMVFKFFGRVQLIIGVFMMFQLAMTIIKGIINPDSFLDSKTGAKNLIMRIIVSLTLLTMLVPINIANPRNEYERRINNHGILFGTLYSLQYRLLNDNTIGRLVFGNENTDYTSSDSDYGGSASQRFASMVLKSFYMLNRDEDGNFVCTGDTEIEEAYDDDDASIFAILAMADDTCDSSGTLNGILTYIEGAWMVGQAVTNPATIPIHATSFFITHNITSEESYVLTVIPIVSTVAGIVLCVLIFMMTFDVAVRAMKLAALQLMAPIPIISYMDPKGGKDGAFNSWVKLLTSTYLDLFIRLAVIYFSLNVVSMLTNKLPELIEATVINPLLMRDIVIIIIIAIFIFAKQAPKFFKQMLGIKDNGEHFFSAFGTAMGLGTAAVGTVGSALTGYKTAKEENDKLHPEDFNNRFRNVGAALLSGIGGGYAGVKAAMGDKGGIAAVMDAQRKHRADRAAHKTLFRGVKDDVLSLASGESPAEAGKKRIAAHKAFQDAQKNWKSALETEAINNGVACDLGGGIVGTYRDLMAALEHTEKGADGKEYIEFGGRHIRADRFTSTYKEDALKAQVKHYQDGNTKAGGTTYLDNKNVGGKLYIAYKTLEKSRDDIGSYVIDDPDITAADRARLADAFNDAIHGGHYDIDDITTYGKALGASNASMSAEQNSMRNIINNANTKENKK